MPAVGDQHRGPPGTMKPAMAGVVSANPFEDRPRRINEYTAQEIASLQSRLDKQLGPEYISSRAGPSGQKVHYLAAEKCINLANEVFGFNGWSSSIQNIQIDFVDESPNTGKISLGLSVIVRVSLKDGTYHEDIGYGHIENCKGKAAAFEKAKKEGTTDGLKRALRTFGNVLGNCIYDKEYLAKVTRVKVAPSKWDVDNLHRHQDYAPMKNGPVQDKRTTEDNDLPPRPTEVNARSNTNSHASSLTFDGDGEFGSDVFDEADFVATTVSNPDEVSLDPEPPRQQQRTYPQAQMTQAPHQPQVNFPRPPRPPRPSPEMVTPSKSERPWIAGPAAGPRHPTPLLQNNTNSVANLNAHSMMQRQSTPGPWPQQPGRNPPAGPQTYSKSSQELTSIAQGSAAIKVEVPVTSANSEAQQGNTAPGQTSGNEPSMDGAPGFYSARAVDVLRDNPQAPPTAALKFDLHAESPSIRKTAGIDHTKSVPVSKPMLPATSPPTNSARDFINPSADIHRRIGAPGGNGIASPVGRGQSTSSYRPLTRPNIDPRNAGANPGLNREDLAPQNAGLKRPPLNDVTNASITSAPAPTSGPGNPKRPRVSTGGGQAPQPPPQQQ